MGMMKTIGFITGGAVIGAAASIMIDKRQHYIDLINNKLKDIADSSIDSKIDDILSRVNNIENMSSETREMLKSIINE